MRFFWEEVAIEPSFTAYKDKFYFRHNKYNSFVLCEIIVFPICLLKTIVYICRKALINNYYSTRT
ncbi:MAG TPA: hypothetical protein DCQ31_12640 [Bacteroidales bacterium]|nr:hypothetical protein [Bacteroidales bacterium]